MEALGELLEQESAFEAHLHDCSVQAGFALAGGIVGLFDVVEAALELDALSVVGLFYRGRERCVLGCFCGAGWSVGCWMRGELGRCTWGSHCECFLMSTVREDWKCESW